MTGKHPFPTDPRFDLVLERTVDVAPALVWRAWTEPEQLMKWFTPRPWQTVDCEIDLRPGGIFRTVMRSPEGQDFDGGAGCYLEIVPHEKLVWTSALGLGYRPAPTGNGAHDLPFTAVILMEPAGTGTRYTAMAIHRDESGRERHERMGFHQGWGMALDQLVALVRTF